MTDNSQSNRNSTQLHDGKATLPSISVVIPTYNNLSLLLECLESVQKLDYPRDLLEVLVVDNASSDRTPDVIADRFPHVRLVRLESNTGFAPACDRGALEAKGQYVAFLNNDAVVAPDWLSALVTALKAGEEGTFVLKKKGGGKYALHIAPLVVLDDRGERIAFPESVATVHSCALTCRAAEMAHHSVWSVDNAIAEHPQPPTQVHVLEIGKILGVKATDFQKGVSVNQHRAARREKYWSACCGRRGKIGPTPY
jgi:glycosyltransferase involved in cell wall biosynthesis